jgi:hypothetical protein
MTNNNLRQDVADLIKKATQITKTQEALSKYLQYSTSSISKIVKSNGGSEKMLNIIKPLLEELIVKETSESYKEKYLNCVNTNFFNIFKNGEYNCYFLSAEKSLESIIMTVKKYEDSYISLKFNGCDYKILSQKEDIYLNNQRNYIVFRFHNSIDTIHLVIRFHHDNIIFAFGFMYYIDLNLSPIVNKIIINQDSNTESLNREEIVHFFRNRYLNQLKLPNYPIVTKSKFKEFFEKQREKGWSTVYYEPFKKNITHIDYDLFISTPISRIGYERFKEYRDLAIKIIEYYKKPDFGYSKIYYQGQNINNENDYSNAQNASDNESFISEVFETIKNTKHFIFINIEDPENISNISSQLFQLGWLLSSSSKKHACLFVRDKNSLPRLVKVEHLKNFKIREEQNFDDIYEHIKNNCSAIFESTELF